MATVGSNSNHGLWSSVRLIACFHLSRPSRSCNLVGNGCKLQKYKCTTLHLIIVCMHNMKQVTHYLANSSFTVAGPAAWNLLPVSIRNTNSHAAFRRQLKTYLFSTPDWLPYLCSLHSVLSVRRCWAPVEWRHSKLLWWWWLLNNCVNCLRQCIYLFLAVVHSVFSRPLQCNIRLLS